MRNCGDCCVVCGTAKAVSPSLSPHPLAPSQTVRQTVLWFSCVAPVAALLTYFFLSLSGALSTQWVALLLVFSGGTFLYVSTVHILPEYASSAMKRRDVAVFVSGILFPLVPSLLDIGHGH